LPPTVAPIDVATNTAGPSIPAGDTPLDIAITPDGATAYVATQVSDNVTPINLATRTPRPPIPSDDPQGIALTPDQAPVARFLVTPAPAGSATTFDESASTVAFGTIASYA
jgi:DNA-binding beta-propeller fold protein YncE